MVCQDTDTEGENPGCGNGYLLATFFIKELKTEEELGEGVLQGLDEEGTAADHDLEPSDKGDNGFLVSRAAQDADFGLFAFGGDGSATTF